MLNKQQLLGQKGEELATHYLQDKGYKILAQNYRCIFGELDIVAMQRSVLVFIEVKTRSSNNFGSAASAVNYRKQQQISRAAQHYLTENSYNDCDARFDVVAITRGTKDQFEVDHIVDAFELAVS